MRLNGKWTNASRTISVLVIGELWSSQFPNDEDRDGSLNIGFLQLNHLTWLQAWKYFIELSRHEAFI